MLITKLGNFSRIKSQCKSEMTETGMMTVDDRSDYVL